MPRLTLDSPIGRITVIEEEGRITRLGWYDQGAADQTPLLLEAKRQLDLYFAGTLKHFELPLAPAGGSEFERRVWEQLLAIPYGEVRLYGDVAHALGGMPRAVGGACGSNPIAVIIPCHRVVGATGLTGYSGGNGIDTKQRLLDLERGQTRLF
jgi:methylated-DNA-[protein]-cysteine S-methyltransferase